MLLTLLTRRASEYYLEDAKARTRSITKPNQTNQYKFYTALLIFQLWWMLSFGRRWCRVCSQLVSSRRDRVLSKSDTNIHIVTFCKVPFHNWLADWVLWHSVPVHRHTWKESSWCTADAFSCGGSVVTSRILWSAAILQTILIQMFAFSYSDCSISLFQIWTYFNTTFHYQNLMIHQYSKQPSLFAATPKRSVKKFHST